MQHNNMHSNINKLLITAKVKKHYFTNKYSINLKNMTNFLFKFTKSRNDHFFTFQNTSLLTTYNKNSNITEPK